MSLMASSPAAGALGIKPQGVLHFFHNTAVQHQLCSDDAALGGGALGKGTALVSAELVLLSQNTVDAVGENGVGHAVHNHITNGHLTIDMLEKYYDFWLRQKDLLSALAYSGMHSKVSQYALKYTDEKWMTEYLVAEDFGMDLSREMNLFVISGLSSLLISWHTEGFQKTPRQMAQIAYRMLSKPLLMHTQK